MPRITLTTETYEDLSLLARAWEVSDGDAVQRLIHQFRGGAPQESTTTAQAEAADGVPIYALYQSERIDALYNPATHRIRVTSGALAGRTFRSPSGAAVAVVQEINPRVDPNRNGWTFWSLARTDETLQTIRYQ